MNKKALSETDIRTKFITPAICGPQGAGWDLTAQVREEAYFTKGRVIVQGKTIRRGKAQKADYLLYYKSNLPIAVVEAKDNNHSAGEVSSAENELDRYALQKDDLLMTEGGDWDKVGRAAIWEGQIPACLHQNHVFRSRMRSPEISPVWFERYFNSPEGRRYFESASKQTTNLASINMRQVRGCPVPFPPLAEQRRIVVNVNELMALVDALESQLATADTNAANLLTAAVAELTTP